MNERLKLRYQTENYLGNRKPLIRTTSSHSATKKKVSFADNAEAEISSFKIMREDRGRNRNDEGLQHSVRIINNFSDGILPADRSWFEWRTTLSESGYNGDDDVVSEADSMQSCQSMLEGITLRPNSCDSDLLKKNKRPRKVVCRYIQKATNYAEDRKRTTNGLVVSKAVFPDEENPSVATPVLYLKKNRQCHSCRRNVSLCPCKLAVHHEYHQNFEPNEDSYQMLWKVEKKPRIKLISQPPLTVKEGQANIRNCVINKPASHCRRDNQIERSVYIDLKNEVTRRRRGTNNALFHHKVPANNLSKPSTAFQNLPIKKNSIPLLSKHHFSTRSGKLSENQPIRCWTSDSSVSTNKTKKSGLWNPSSRYNEEEKQSNRSVFEKSSARMKLFDNPTQKIPSIKVATPADKFSSSIVISLRPPIPKTNRRSKTNSIRLVSSSLEKLPRQCLPLKND